MTKARLRWLTPLMIIVIASATACAEDKPRYLHESNPIAVPVFVPGQVTFPVGRHLKTTNVSYSNLAEGTVVWGDPVGGFYEWNYYFERGRLVATEQILSIPTEGRTQTFHPGTVRYHDDGFEVDTIGFYGDGRYTVVEEHDQETVYSNKPDGGNMELRVGPNMIALQRSSNRDESEIVELTRVIIDGDEIVAERFVKGRTDLQLQSRTVFREGIKVEDDLFYVNVRETYSVIEGEGVMRRYNSDGELLLEARLTRERDEYGLMTREVIELPSGAGSIRTWEMEY